MQYRPQADEVRPSPASSSGPTATVDTQSHEDGLPTPRRYIAAAAVLAAIVLAVLDGAIANVALPTISRMLDVSPAASIWVVTGYQVSLVVALLPCAALGESFGYRRVFTLGVVLFTAASALCAMSSSLPWLIAARFLQGFGAAAIMALIAALLRFTYPHRLVGTAIGWNALTVALSSAAGPTIGAGILSLASWPWLFAVNIPVGIIVLAASRALPEHKGTGRPIDYLSVALNASFFAPLVVGVDFLTTRTPLAIGLLTISAISLVALVRREMHREAPLIPLDLLRSPSFRISVIASVCCFTAQMISYIALPFYLQHSLGETAFMTGLYMTPWPLTVAFAAPISGRMAGRVPTAWLCAAGGACLAVGLAFCAFWPLREAMLALVPLTMICGLGFGFFQTPINRTMLGLAPTDRSGAAGGMLAMARLFGQTSGGVAAALLFHLFGPATNAPLIVAAVAAATASAFSFRRLAV